MRRSLFALLSAHAPALALGQVLCVSCFEQNEPVNTGVSNLVLNGSFEQSTCTPLQDVFCPNSALYACDIDGWTCLGGGPETYAKLYTNVINFIADGVVAVYFGNHICNACSATPGDTSCLVATDCGTSAPPPGYPMNSAAFGGSAGVSLQQVVSGLTIGEIYALEFWAGGESNPLRGLFTVDVGFGPIHLRNKPTWNGPGTVGTRYVVMFTASATSHAITFTNWGHICNSCTELVIDDVRLFLATHPCATGLPAERPVRGLALYPQPFDASLTVEPGSAAPATFTLVDPSGRPCLRRELLGTAVLNTEGLPPGAYAYELRTADGAVRKGSVIKQ